MSTCAVRDYKIDLPPIQRQLAEIQHGVVTMVDQASWYRFKSQIALKSYPTEGHMAFCAKRLGLATTEALYISKAAHQGIATRRTQPAS
ncbi:hypothetical protein EVAR_101585_1 [Eumeta japonica]|uniref:Uncharacterized protein n=1 Tax=Eumeta variegata TaxID=151549 RepID=A0A4C1TSK3_EUMVA|nr:hypothetical protein EVAR_101585_1 [Eumeta japonica]